MGCSLLQPKDTRECGETSSQHVVIEVVIEVVILGLKLARK
jgi:hypothetical protein